MTNLPFPSVKLSYDGKTYEVEPDRVWGLIGTIEEVITRTRLAVCFTQKDLPETKIAQAYSNALTYAGAKGITPQDVRIGSNIPELMEHAQSLFNILSIPDMPEDMQEGKEPGKRRGRPKKNSA